jgi:hypothetical protein
MQWLSISLGLVARQSEAVFREHGDLISLLSFLRKGK